MLYFCFSVLCLIFIVVLFIYQLNDWLRLGRAAENYPERVKVKNKNYSYFVVYLILTASELLVHITNLIDPPETSSPYPELKRTAYLLMTIVWVLFLVFFLLFIIKNYVYITPEGVLRGSGKKGLIPASEWSYDIDGDTLLLYYKEAERPAKYGITDNKQELEAMLTEHYNKKINNKE